MIASHCSGLGIKGIAENIKKPWKQGFLIVSILRFHLLLCTVTCSTFIPPHISIESFFKSLFSAVQISASINLLMCPKV